MGKGPKEIYTPKEDAERVDEVILLIREKTKIKLFRKELWNLLLQDPTALADLAIVNINKNTADAKIKLY